MCNRMYKELPGIDSQIVSCFLRYRRLCRPRIKREVVAIALVDVAESNIDIPSE